MQRQQLGLATLVSLVVLAGVTAIGAAAAGNPGVHHFTETASLVDDDFCGTAESVSITEVVHGTEFLAPNRASYWNTSVGNAWFSANGATVVEHFAGPFIQQIVSTNADGSFTALDSNAGLPELLKTTHGSLLSRDAGYITFLDTFDANGNLVASVPVLVRGPHPEAEQDFTVFCDVVTAALGL
jgi:hypothetical protein